MTSVARVDALWGGVPYQRSVPVLTFTLLGLPISQGSKAYKGHRRGKPVLVESAKGLKPWRIGIQAAIVAAMRHTAPPASGWPLLGPLAVDLCFTMRKPVGAPKLRRTWPIVYPDIDKLCRAVLDEGKLAKGDRPGLWHDDSQVVDLHAWKVYPLETPHALRQPGLAAAVYLIDEPRPPGGEQAALL
jgi:Holliday junction resolvase RusA-like endonuclease